MIIIQEASTAIGKVSKQLSGFEGKQKEVADALKDISSRISSLESDNAAVRSLSVQTKKIKPPLYVRVRVKARAN